MVAAIPPEDDVRAALDDADSLYEAGKTLRVGRDTMKRAVTQYGIEKPDYWVDSPQKALRLAQKRAGGD